jgi:hypothetical protein
MNKVHVKLRQVQAVHHPQEALQLEEVGALQLAVVGVHRAAVVVELIVLKCTAFFKTLDLLA